MKNTQGRLITMARRFSHVLDSGDATELLSLTPKNRQTAMCALSNLAKYRGVYREWKLIIKRYQLRWSTGSEQFNQEWIESLLSGEGQIEEMMQWLRSACARLRPKYCNMLACGAICGLRPNEVPMSLELLRTDRANYVVQKSGIYVLQHFRYKQFNRKTKKALITVLTPEGMKFAESLEPVTLNALQCAVKRHVVGVYNVKWGRKIHGTLLRKAGLHSEEIDLLAGRLPMSVFERHYLRGGIDWSKFAKAVDQLYIEIAPLIKQG